MYKRDRLEDMSENEEKIEDLAAEDLQISSERVKNSRPVGSSAGLKINAGGRRASVFSVAVDSRPACNSSAYRIGVSATAAASAAAF